MAVYRGLLRADIQEERLRLWNNELVLVESATKARLSFVISVLKSGPKLLWTLAAAEQGWVASVRESKAWLHQQLKGLGPDKLGAQSNPDYYKVCRIKKASQHARLQRALNVKWEEWHRLPSFGH